MKRNIMMKQSIYLTKYLLFTLLLCVGSSAWGQLTKTSLAGSMYNNGGSDPTLNTATGLVYGDGNVNYQNYADLVNYKMLELNVTEGTPRLLFNRAEPDGSDTNGGAYLEINSASSPYVTAQGSTWRIDLEKIKLNDAGHNVHLNAIKGANYQNVNIKSITLYSYPSNSLTPDIYFAWLSAGQSAERDWETTATCANEFGNSKSNNDIIYGHWNVESLQYANLSSYSKLQLAYTGDFPRILFNRQNMESSGNGMIEISSAGTYATVADGIITIDLAALGDANGGYVHLNAIKAPWSGTTTVYSGRLYTEADWASINPVLIKGTPGAIREEELVIPSNNQFTISAAYFKTLLGSYPGYLRFTAYNSNNEMIEIPEVTSAYRNWTSLERMAMRHMIVSLFSGTMKETLS